MEQPDSGQADGPTEWLPSGHVLFKAGAASEYSPRRFLGKAERVCGLDMNASALRHAKRRHPYVPFVCGSAEHLPFADDSFDVIVMLEVIEHTYSDVAALTEIRRVLKVGGTLVLSTPNAGL